MIPVVLLRNFASFKTLIEASFCIFYQIFYPCGWVEYITAGFSLTRAFLHSMKGGRRRGAIYKRKGRPRPRKMLYAKVLTVCFAAAAIRYILYSAINRKARAGLGP